MISWVARDRIVSVPLASTTGTMVQKTPIGVKYIIGADDLQTYFVTGNQSHVRQRLPFFADQPDQGKTDDNGKYKNLKHISAVQKQLPDWTESGFLTVSRILAHIRSCDIGCCHLER